MAGRGKGEVDKELPHPGFFEEGSVEDEQKNKSCAYPERNAKNPFRGQKEMLHNAANTVSAVS